MNITIKKIGYNIGTIGWLATGLQNGEITIAEGTMKSNGHHGLWLKAGTRSQFLAAQNQYNASHDEFIGASNYHCCDDQERDGIFTDACWAALMEIAQQWCQGLNAERAEDAGAFDFVVSRVVADVAHGVPS